MSQDNDKNPSDLMNRSLMIDLCTNAYNSLDDSMNNQNQQQQNMSINSDQIEQPRPEVGLQEINVDLIPLDFQVQHNSQFQFCKRKCINQELQFGCVCIDGILACFKEPICTFQTNKTGLGQITVRRSSGSIVKDCKNCIDWCLNSSLFYTNIPAVPIVLFASENGDLQVFGKNLNAGFVFYKKKFIGNIEQNLPRCPDYFPVSKHCGGNPQILISDRKKQQYMMHYDKATLSECLTSLCVPCIYLKRSILVLKDNKIEFTINMSRTLFDVLYVCCNGLFNELWPTYDVKLPQNYDIEQKILMVASLIFYIELSCHY